MPRDYHLNNAAEAYWLDQLSTKASGLDSYHLGVLDAFKAGAAWQAGQPGLTATEVGRLVPRDAGPIRSPHGEVMTMLEAINKAIVDRYDAHAKDLYHMTHRQETIDIEQRRMLVDVGQNVEAVLDQVTPHDNGTYAEAAEEIDMGGVVHVAVDCALPGSDKAAVWAKPVIDLGTEEPLTERYRKEIYKLTAELNAIGKALARSQGAALMWRKLAEHRKAVIDEQSKTLDAMAGSAD